MSRWLVIWRWVRWTFTERCPICGEPKGKHLRDCKDWRTIADARRSAKQGVGK